MRQKNEDSSEEIQPVSSPGKALKTEIPNSLIKRLQGLGSHFCLVKTRGKDPSIGGKGWQKPENLLSAEDLRLQEHLKRGGNYGVVGGFGLVIVDTDIPELKEVVREKLPPTFTVESPGSHGWHSYFLCGLEKPIRLRDKNKENIGDIQGPGKMVVGPNSIHPNGGIYKIIDDRPLAQITRQQLIEAFKEFVVPDKEIEQIEVAARMEKHQLKVDLAILQIVPLSGLHKRGNEYFGPHPIHGSKTRQNFWVNPSKNCWHCFRHGSGGGPLLWLAVEEGLIDCSEAGSGALRGEIFKQVLQKARERGLIKTDLKKEAIGEETKKLSQADLLVKLALTHAKKLFHDDRQVPYIQLQNSDVLTTLRLRSREIKSWLAGLLWKTFEKAPNQEALGSALNVLEAQCQEGSRYKLYNRIAPGEDGSIWLDMADQKWRAIHITKEGWQIVDDSPILFRRYSHQKAILEPVRGGDIWELLEFANIKNEGDKLLYIVTSVTCLIPGIPHVIVILFGPQGSGKTCTLKVLRALVDPSQLDLLNLPRRERELVQNLDHHWCSFYDNVGRIPEWCSNVFCRAVTGAGVSKRALYTDDDDVIYSYHRCIGLTDINIAAERGDMLQRGLLLGLESIPKPQRKTEKELNLAFEKAYSRIFGAMLDVLVKAIQIYPMIKLGGLHRMADYVVWGCAITEALGKDKQAFLDAYEENVINQNLEMVRASPISDALMRLMEENPLGWEGTPSQLFTLLEEKAKELKISTRQKAWPKKPHVLTRRLNELAPSLPSIGYQIETTRTGKTRKISISSVKSVTSVTPKHEVGDGSDGNDGTFESFSEDVKECTRLESNIQGECAICKTRGRMDWTFTKHNDEWGLLCEVCGLMLNQQREEV